MFLTLESLQGPPYFGDVADVYGKKGTLMRFTPPMFGTIDSRSAVGLTCGLSFNVATGEFRYTCRWVLLGCYSFPYGSWSHYHQGVQGTGSGHGCLCLQVDVTPRDMPVGNFRTSLPLSVFLCRVNGFSYNSFLAKDLQGKSTGYDSAAFDANGRILPYEIENWDPEGVSEIWVRTYDLNTSNAITWHGLTLPKWISSHTPMMVLYGPIILPVSTT